MAVIARATKAIAISSMIENTGLLTASSQTVCYGFVTLLIHIRCVTLLILAGNVPVLSAIGFVP